MEALINSQVKQLNSLRNSLSKRKEAFGDENEMTCSATSEALSPCSRARVQSDTSLWSYNAATGNHEKIPLKEEEEDGCDSEESFKTASDD